GPLRLLLRPNGPHGIPRLGPPLDPDVHRRRSPPLTPQPFQTSRARRPRHGGDWTYRHSGLSRSSQGLPASSPDSLRMFSTSSAPWIVGPSRGSLDGLHFRYGLPALLAVAPHAPSRERSYRAFPAK